MCFFLKKLKKVVTHNFLVGNRECNTESGFKNQLYIELGWKPHYEGTWFMFPSKTFKVMIRNGQITFYARPKNEYT